MDIYIYIFGIIQECLLKWNCIILYLLWVRDLRNKNMVFLWDYYGFLATQRNQIFAVFPWLESNMLISHG